MVTTRSGKRTDSNLNNDDTTVHTNDAHPSKFSNSSGTGGTCTAETRNEPSTKEYRYPPCKRHPRGGVKCATCFRANKTEAELSKYIQECHKRRMPYPRKSTGGKAPRKHLIPTEKK